MKTLKFRVTAQDIRNGEPGSNTCCPIAIAVKRTTKASQVRVFCLVSYWSGIKIKATFYFSKKLADFVHRFDAGKPVKPTTFVLRRVK